MNMMFVLKELTRRKSRTFIAVLTVAIISSILILVTVFLNTYSSAIYLPFKGIDADLIIQKTSDNKTNNSNSKIRIPFGKDLFTAEEIYSISSLKHVKDMAGSLVIWQFEKNGFTAIEGVEPESFLSKKYKSWIADGNFLIPVNEKTAVVESHFAKFNNMKTGNTIFLNDIKFKITGILKVNEESQVFASSVYIKTEDAEAISGINGLNQIYLKLDDISSEDLIKKSIKKINDKIIPLSGSSISSSLGNVSSIYKKFYWIGLSIITILLILILAKLNTISLYEKSRDIGIMQSIGWTGPNIITHILMETGIKTIIGFISGVVISRVFILIVSSVTLKYSPSGLSLNSESSVSVPVLFSPFVVLIYFVLVSLISLSAAYYFAGKMAYMKPLKNLGKL